MSTTSKSLFSLSGLAVLAVLFIALVMLSNMLLRGARLDLTENNLYTMSEGTRSMLSKVDEPINLYFFYSESTARDLPTVRPYANRVRETLEEFVASADGKIRLQVIDPQPFSEQEDQAAQFGLRGAPVASGEQLYLGLAGTNSVGDEEIIPFFELNKEAFLEYDIAKMIYSLSVPDKPVIGMMSTIAMGGDFDPQTRRTTEPWVIDEQIEAVYELRDISPGATAIDADVDVLVLVHPKGLSDETLYGIDQFLLGGGKAMIFVDPYAEVDQPTPDPNDPTGGMLSPRHSNLSRLFSVWGIEVPDKRVVLDNRYGLQVSTGSTPTRHIGLLGIDAEGLDDNDVVTSGIGSLNMGIAGYIELAEDAAVTMTPLITSSVESGSISGEPMQFVGDPGRLMNEYTADDKRYVLAARIGGKVPSAFPDGAPGDGDTEGFIAEGDINVVVVTDVDMLADRYWVRAQNFFGQRLVTAWAGNGDFVLNTLDNLTGSSDLIAIRGRATYRRPFDRVQALEREADARFRATEESLQQELEATETRLTELQSRREDDNALIMTDEQREEIQRFLEQRTNIRKELRRVRRDLDKDIQGLGTWLKVINIGLMPVLLSIGAIFAVWLNTRRRRRTEG